MDPTKIYPTPEQPGLNHTKNAPNPETVNSPPGTPIKHLRPLDYLKLIGLGVFVSVSVYIVFFLILAVILANFVFGMIFIGAGGHILALAAVFIGYYALLVITWPAGVFLAARRLPFRHVF